MVLGFEFNRSGDAFSRGRPVPLTSVQRVDRKGNRFLYEKGTVGDICLTRYCAIHTATKKQAICLHFFSFS